MYFCTAICKGVYPSLFLAFGSAPRANKHSTHLNCLYYLLWVTFIQLLTRWLLQSATECSRTDPSDSHLAHSSWRWSSSKRALLCLSKLHNARDWARLWLGPWHRLSCQARRNRWSIGCQSAQQSWGPCSLHWAPCSLRASWSARSHQKITPLSHLSAYLHWKSKLSKEH